jgi:hypothetical protein
VETYKKTLLNDNSDLGALAKSLKRAEFNTVMRLEQMAGQGTTEMDAALRFIAVDDNMQYDADRGVAKGSPTASEFKSDFIMMNFHVLMLQPFWIECFGSLFHRPTKLHSVLDAVLPPNLVTFFIRCNATPILCEFASCNVCNC